MDVYKYPTLMEASSTELVNPNTAGSSYIVLLFSNRSSKPPSFMVSLQSAKETVSGCPSSERLHPTRLDFGGLQALSKGAVSI